MKDASSSEIGERAQHLLRVLVENYIREGNPIGSQTLLRGSGLEISSATVRNIMADLEKLGFVSSPHTSAGRIPTIKGYRFFVDTLVKLSPPNAHELKRLQQDLDEAAGDPHAVALSASNLLSAVTKLAGIVTLPRRPTVSLRQIEFLPLSSNRVLAILVLNDRDVQNKILDVQREFSDTELRQAANFLTEQFGGKDLLEVRRQLVRELEEARETVNSLMLDAIRMADKILPASDTGPEYVLAGEMNLLNVREMADVETLKSVFEAFTRRRDILHLLDQCLNAEGVQIFIGQESGYELLDSCSIVSATYVAEDESMGVIGVIGPTRMEYERVIPIVDITAKLLGRALKY